jgi:Skp family chaperone for outer membrane proteins
LAIQAKEMNDYLNNSDILLTAIKAKILSCFITSKKDQELLEELQEFKTKATDRLKELQKLQEEQEKKNKKMIGKKTVGAGKNQSSNNPGNGNINNREDANKMGEEEKLNDLLGKNKFYFTKGFCIVDWPRDKEGGEKMEEEITGFVDENRRKNEEGEEKKSNVGFLVNPPKKNEVFF